MIRLAGGGLIGLALIALWIYCIFDVISTEESLVRSQPKMAWLLIVIILPDIGSIAWLLLGRPVFAGWRPGDTSGRKPRRVVGPEDPGGFLIPSHAFGQGSARGVGGRPPTPRAGPRSQEAGRSPAAADHRRLTQPPALSAPCPSPPSNGGTACQRNGVAEPESLPATDRQDVIGESCEPGVACPTR